MENPSIYNQANPAKGDVLVLKKPDLNPVPGYTTVVFQKIGAGWRFYKTAPPDKKIWGIPFREYVAYAVNCDSNLRYRFKSWITLRDHHQPIDLIFLVDYFVVDAVRVAELAINSSDPLIRLQDRIEQELGSAISSASWLEVKDRLDSVVSRATDRQGDVEAEIHSFALSLGIEIKRINVKHPFIEESTEILSAIQKVKEDEIKLEFSQRLQSMGQQHELEMGKLKGKIERQEKGLDTVSTALGQAITMLTNTIESPDGLRRTAVTVLETLQDLSSLISNPVGNSRTALGGNKFPEPLLLSGGVEEMLHNVINQISGLSCPIADKNNLLSAYLYLYAECLLRGKANAEDLKRYQHRVEDLLADLTELAPYETQTLGKLCDPKRIKEALV